MINTRTKITIILFLFVSVTGSVFSQYRKNSITEFFNLSDSLCLFINDEYKGFLIFFKKDIIPGKKAKPFRLVSLEDSHIKYTFNVDVYDLESRPETYHFSEGTVRINGSKIICYDSKFKRYYTFKQTDEYTLVATKHTALFTKGDTLKMYSLWMNEGGYHESMSWKGNKKDGVWESSEWFGDSVRYMEYRNDTIIRRYAKSYRSNFNLEDTIINLKEIEVTPFIIRRFPSLKNYIPVRADL